MRANLAVVGVVMLLTTAIANSASHAQSSARTLREAASDRLLVGTAIMSTALDDPKLAALIAEQFNCLTGENEFKPLMIQPEQGKFNFEPADRIVAFAQQHDMKVIGHTLCWHSQTGRWMYVGADGNPLPREQALANLKNHIDTVVGHFKGKVLGWDVVNEAINDQGGSEYLRDTPAKRAIGEDFLAKAFEFAHAADPDAELYYNDFSIERPDKREKVIRLIRELKSKNIRIDGVGIQGHWLLKEPSLQMIDEAIAAFAAEGVKVMVTELDIDVLPRRQRGADVNATERNATNPYTRGIPPEVLDEQARRYGQLFKIFAKHRGEVTRVTLWGVHDGQSWLNNWPSPGRTNYPLLFDRQMQAKPALKAVIETLRQQ